MHLIYLISDNIARSSMITIFYEVSWNRNFTNLTAECNPYKHQSRYNCFYITAIVSCFYPTNSSSNLTHNTLNTKIDNRLASIYKENDIFVVHKLPLLWDCCLHSDRHSSHNWTEEYCSKAEVAQDAFLVTHSRRKVSICEMRIEYQHYAYSKSSIRRW